MKRLTAAVAASAGLALALVGCSTTGETTTDESSSATAPTSDLQVALAYDIGGRGDKSYNDAAAAGIDAAIAELGIEVKELEATVGETDAQKTERLRLLASAGYDAVIAIGFGYAGPLQEVSAEFPDTHFAIVDDSSFEADNVANLVFSEAESSYLAGVIAAQASETGHVGFIGGVNLPGIQKFYTGFAAGVAAVDDSIVIEEKYLTEPPDFSGFNDPAKGSTVAAGMIDSGVDVIYAAAGGSGSGVFEAASAADGVWVIGVDSDQYLSADEAVKDVILTSAIKRVDTAVYDFITAVNDGNAPSGVQLFDLSNDGVGYTTSNSAVEPYTALADDFEQQIIDGTVTVPGSN